MLVELIRKFAKNTLRITDLIEHAITDLGGGLYGYMLTLEKSDRKLEAEMIKQYRTDIFALRDKFSKGQVVDVLMVDELEKIYGRLSIQLKMLDTVPERRWELALFQSYTNEFLGLIHICKDIHSGTLIQEPR